MSAGHGHVDPSNKKIALLISVLALALALAETLGKSAQTAALDRNIEAANLWAFFQAKTIRQTTLRSAAELLAAQSGTPPGEAAREQMRKWREAAERYESEERTQEGRKELAARARAAEKKRDIALAAYHHYELASGAMQIAIVLASAEIITGVAALAWIAGGLGVLGIVFGVIGFWFPTAVHFF
jgi:hypothetical protein